MNSIHYGHSEEDSLHTLATYMESRTILTI